jgi:hypothetical protein
MQFVCFVAATCDWCGPTTRISRGPGGSSGRLYMDRIKPYQLKKVAKITYPRLKMRNASIISYTLSSGTNLRCLMDAVAAPITPIQSNPIH